MYHLTFICSVVFCLVADTGRATAKPDTKSSPAPVPPYSANTDISKHALWGEHAKGDPNGAHKTYNWKYDKNKKPLTSGYYIIQNLYGCKGETGEDKPPSGGKWQCHKYVGDTDNGYLALYGNQKFVWNLEETEKGSNSFYIRREGCEKFESSCRYWYDDPDKDEDWMTISTYKRTAWRAEPRRQGYRLYADHPCGARCRRNVTWKGAGISWKYLYAGDDEGVDFDFIYLGDKR